MKLSELKFAQEIINMKLSELKFAQEIINMKLSELKIHSGNYKYETIRAEDSLRKL